MANVTRKTGTSFSRILPVEIWCAIGAGQYGAKGLKYETGGLTSTLRISRTRLSDTRPCFRYCSIVAHNMLYVWKDTS